jgi:antibiotic biosynthesis monooxygenase (ABM) superfamily enzyme
MTTKQAAGSPPPVPIGSRSRQARWRVRLAMTLGTWLSAFLVVLTLLSVFKDELASLPLAARALVLSGVLVTVMTTVVLPALNTAIVRWVSRSRPGA